MSMDPITMVTSENWDEANRPQKQQGLIEGPRVGCVSGSVSILEPQKTRKKIKKLVWAQLEALSTAISNFGSKLIAPVGTGVIGSC